MTILFDPIVRAPIWGSVLIGQTAGLLGAFVFLQKRSLVGEVLSHATYPGMVIGALLSLLISSSLSFGIFLGALVTALGGLVFLKALTKKWKLSSDTALCLVLSIFLGFAMLLLSGLQKYHFLIVSEVQLFLLGQAATIQDKDLWLYGVFALLALLWVVLLFRSLQIFHFDEVFATTVGVSTKVLQWSFDTLLVVLVLVGMRSVGIVMMTSLLVAPAVAARKWTDRFAFFLFLASSFGCLSGLIGSILSIKLDRVMLLPTGPVIALIATSVCIYSLLCAPKHGVLARFYRVGLFRFRCAEENMLKGLYQKRHVTRHVVLSYSLSTKGLLKKGALTDKGIREARRLVRLHRLWEVYLVHMRQSAHVVHQYAEEIEHFLTPDLEKQLQALLDDPTLDPHDQPIPKQSEEIDR